MLVDLNDDLNDDMLMLVDLPDDMWRAIAKQLAESDLASAVALKRCSSRFKDLAAPLVANAVERTDEKWRDAAAEIGGRGAATITGGLERNEVLTELDLARSGIDDAGAEALASALRVNAVLKSLDVRCNGISGDAAQQLATAVLASPPLEIFGSVPLKELRANTLEKLDLTDKFLGLPEALVLAKLVEGSGVLKTLNLRRNNIRDKGEGVSSDSRCGERAGKAVGFELEM